MVDCAFCAIIAHQAPAFRVFENELIIAILDILPTRLGHVLVIPKDHFANLSDLPQPIARELGFALTRISKAMTLALDNPGLTVTLNQVYAQVVPHVHFHLVPALVLGAASEQMKTRFKFQGSQREELDDEDAERILTMIKARL